MTKMDPFLKITTIKKKIHTSPSGSNTRSHLESTTDTACKWLNGDGVIRAQTEASACNISEGQDVWVEAVHQERLRFTLLSQINLPAVKFNSYEKS